jgi:hypothetical protein
LPQFGFRPWLAFLLRQFNLSRRGSFGIAFPLVCTREAGVFLHAGLLRLPYAKQGGLSSGGLQLGREVMRRRPAPISRKTP